MSDISSFSKPVSLSELVSSFIPGPANGLEVDYTASLVGRIVDRFHGEEVEEKDDCFKFSWQTEKTLRVSYDGKAYLFEIQLVPGESSDSISDRLFKLVKVSTK